uniref:Uncharacterized protein n=1 Tax=Pseudictyota dubia TaxID=2749911 RepID=A0A7R9ZAG7_9STRA|mmetsp:Transcript_32371/g.59529  ORF Transcript_32371/g.59529 Transcript_32371/m.59529 type:complete len:135 (+) Transcript_32371:195-599(+)
MKKSAQITETNDINGAATVVFSGTTNVAGATMSVKPPVTANSPLSRNKNLAPIEEDSTTLCSTPLKATTTDGVVVVPPHGGSREKMQKEQGREAEAPPESNKPAGPSPRRGAYRHARLLHARRMRAGRGGHAAC